jgi:hypothetical protein
MRPLAAYHFSTHPENQTLGMKVCIIMNYEVHYVEEQFSNRRLYSILESKVRGKAGVRM